MRVSHRHRLFRRAAIGGVLAAAAAFAVVGSGTPQENATLTGTNGSWTNSPSKFDYAWLRCDKNGGSCAAIGGANKTTYTLASSDVGNTIRFRVTASNSAGNNTAASAPTAL